MRACLIQQSSRCNSVTIAWQVCVDEHKMTFSLSRWVPIWYEKREFKISARARANQALGIRCGPCDILGVSCMGPADFLNRTRSGIEIVADDVLRRESSWPYMTGSRCYPFKKNYQVFSTSHAALASYVDPTAHRAMQLNKIHFRHDLSLLHLAHW